MKKLQGNLWKFAIHKITNKRTYMTFLTIYLLTMPNATAKTIGMLTALGQIVGFLFEIPSGYISDRIGHKKALLLARISFILSTSCYVLASSVPWFFLGAIFLAMGFAFNSGTDNAFMHNVLTALGKEKRYAFIMGRLQSLGFAVPIIFIILLPYIAETNFKLAFLVALIVDVIGLLAVLLLVSPKIKNVEEISLHNFKQALREWRNVGWVRYILIGSIISGLIFGATAGFKNPYQEIVGFSISSLGLLWATSRFLISGLLLLNGWIHKTLSYKQFIIMKTLVYSLSFLGIGLTNNMWIVASLFIAQNTFSMGLLSAGSQYNLDFIKNSKSKATLLSVNQLITKIFGAITSLTMGFLVLKYYYSTSYLIMGIILTLILIVSIFYLKNSTLKTPSESIKL